MRLRTIRILTRKEFRDAVRNRWFGLYAASFAVLAVAFSAAALLGSGQFGFANFGRTAASLINLVLLVVPLMGLVAGAQSLAGERERGTLGYLLAQPVSRTEVYLAKFLGQGAALCGALLGGFACSAAVIALRGGGGEAGVMGGLAALSVLLCLASLSVGMALSSAARTSAAALGGAVFLWLLLAFGCDVGLIGAAVLGPVKVGTLWTLSLFNPLGVFRMAAVLSMRSSLEILGPAGMYAARTYGGLLLPLFACVLVLWTAAPLLGGLRVFARRDAV